MLIGVVSDTHYPFKMKDLPCKLKEAFKNVDLILHAGDINDLEILKWLSEIAPIVAVAGNGDDREVVRALGYARSVFVAGYHIGLVHGHQGATESFSLRALHWFPEADIVVFGHTHQPLEQQCEDGRYLLNPGSIGVPVGENKPSAALLELTSNKIESNIIYFD